MAYFYLLVAYFVGGKLIGQLKDFWSFYIFIFVVVLAASLLVLVLCIGKDVIYASPLHIQ